LKKPFSPRDLLDIVDKLIGGSGDVSNAKIKTSIDRENEKTFHNINIQSTGIKSESNKNAVYNLDWSDLSEANGKKTELPKIKSIDLSSDEQGLSIDEDQYGLTNHDEAGENAVLIGKKDEDYDWFLNEMQRELENKPASAEYGRNKEEKSILSSKPSSNNISAGNLNYDDIESPQKKADYDDFIKGLNDEGETSFKSSGLEKESPDVPKMDKIRAESDAKLSEDEIDLIADQIAIKLATAIAAKIDKSQIVQIIKNSLG
jgi:hypothetical protein